MDSIALLLFHTAHLKISCLEPALSIVIFLTFFFAVDLEKLFPTFYETAHRKNNKECEKQLRETWVLQSHTRARDVQESIL